MVITFAKLIERYPQQSFAPYGTLDTFEIVALVLDKLIKRLEFSSASFDRMEKNSVGSSCILKTITRKANRGRHASEIKKENPVHQIKSKKKKN